MSVTPSYRLKRLSIRYTLVRGVEVCSIAIAAALLTWAILGWIYVSEGLRWSVTIAAGIITGLTLAYFRNLFTTDTNFLIHYLNNQYPVLEDSADLLRVENEELNLIQRIQQARVTERFDELYPEIKLPNKIGTTSVVATSLFFVAILLMAFAPGAEQRINSQLRKEINQINKQSDEIKLESLEVTITPPKYTAQPSRRSESLQLTLPEGSNVLWTARFNKSVNSWLILSGRDSVAFTYADGMHKANQQLTETGFYQLAWQENSNWIHSDYYKIEVHKDQAPRIEVKELDQFTRLSFTSNLKVNLKATLQDDHGLTQAGVIATVSKGSGESVKFREEKLAFSSPEQIKGKQVNASVTLDLLKLGMEPGDELYFYVEARDNKEPQPNYNRTETFFIAIQDTTRYEVVDDEGLGVDLMPEYFRSQRQIIIDTEKLLKEKKRITTQQFKFTSNELGYDQKVLRLRYGQFMGEEFEDQIGGVTVSPEELADETAEETVERLSHKHDTENEHNLVEQKKQAADNHNHGEEKEGDLLAAFAHQHDDGEVATFFIESMRTKLKAALTVMWDAELYLRLYEPEKSLPYQYTALKLLKEISNDSRIYVHRTGFDPPPLKEERRLSGDLAEVKSNTGLTKAHHEKKYPAIQDAQQRIENLLQHSGALTQADRNLFTKAGNELAIVAIEEPGKYLQGLTVLKQLSEQSLSTDEIKPSLLLLRSIFWQVAPAQPTTPARQNQSVHPLDQEFLKKINE
ncbi:MAG TPA: hypothetical protein PLM56_12450 [Cyclobacteriaceae bacterium]|nr:DUF4175 family protein [Cytophagales bacterium]HRE68231.1 hypothetical protein [Cyclobacteriaceae bacterium]HRF34305.1 hypothetical protein [Cyclobacteriaceae bacterium]